MINKKTPKIDFNIKKEFRNKTILITGGAGSIGSALTKKILEYPVSSVRVLDIDEYSLFKLKRYVNDPRLRLLLGNILDKDRVDIACHNVDIIFHVAAVKNIEISEYNPIETIDVNVNGTVNLIKIAMRNNPKKFINISTDKAAESSTLYGTTKQLSEKIISWASGRIGSTKFASVRFGNVIETRGNVFEVWNEEIKNNQPISITDPTMKRYFFHIDEAVNFILKCLLLMKNGEVFVPKMRSYSIKEMALKYSKNFRVIGLRPGEKMEELLLSDNEKKNAIEHKDMWVIPRHEY